MKGETKQVR